MDLNMYDIIYLLSSIFGTYTIYKFFGIFFSTAGTNWRKELLWFSLYNIFIVLIYLFVNIPIVMMASNLLGFFLLSYIYRVSFKTRILAVLLIYLTLICIEMLIVTISGYIKFSVAEQNSYSSILGILIIRLVSYVVVTFINNFRNLRKGRIIPTTYWLCITVIPAASLYIIIVLFCSTDLTSIQLILSIMLLFAINFTAFHLYDVITKVLNEQMDKKLTEQQNLYYNKQFILIKESLQATKEIKHDWKNHLSTLYNLIQNGQTDSTLNHISKLLEFCNNKERQINCGNVIVDSILNYKIQESAKYDILVQTDISIPEDLNIPSFDLTVIIGNLMDNAMEAVLKINDNRYIEFKMIYDRGRLLFYSKNAYIGELKGIVNNILTSKQDKENHGIGFKSIKNVLKKYDGDLNIQAENKIFTTEIIMYLKE